MIDPADERFDTLERCIIDLVMNAADRAALVRPAQGEKCAAVCAIMASSNALTQLGSGLLEIARGLGNAPSDFGAPEISETIGLRPLFEIADAAPHGWCWAQFKYGLLEITIAIFSREVEKVAAVCTANGAPCSLESERPAEGWTINKYIQR